MNTFNVILRWNNSHYCPKLLLCIIIHHASDDAIFWYILNMFISDSSFATAGRSSPFSGCRIFLESVASNYKCFSLQHICPKWSLIAHWRMHDIKCLQTWNNHVLSLLEIVRSGIVLITMLNKTEVFITHQKHHSVSILIMPIVYVWEIIFILLVHLLMLLFAS